MIRKIGGFYMVGRVLTTTDPVELQPLEYELWEICHDRNTSWFRKLRRITMRIRLNRKWVYFLLRSFSVTGSQFQREMLRFPWPKKCWDSAFSGSCPISNSGYKNQPLWPASFLEHMTQSIASMHKRRTANWNSVTACQIQQSWCTQSFSVICIYIDIFETVMTVKVTGRYTPVIIAWHWPRKQIKLREIVCPRHSWPHGLAYLESPLPILVPQRAHSIALVSQNYLLPRERSLWVI